MINREMRAVTVISYADTVDEYGQKRQGTSTERTTDMVVKLYSQSNTSDVRYLDVEVIGLTKDKNITVQNRIKFDSVEYDVLYLIPSGRYTQVLMRKRQ